MKNQNHNDTMKQLTSYWREKLADLPSLDLPTDRPRPAIQSLRGETHLFNLTLDLTEALKTLSQRENVNLFVTLVTAFQVLLYRHSGQDDIVVGAVEVNRQNQSLGNPVPLHTFLSGSVSFGDFLIQMRDVVLDAYANQDMTFEKLVETLCLELDSSRNPLFQVLFVFHNNHDESVCSEFLALNTETTPFDLAVELLETSHGLAGKVKYATDLFDVSTIVRFIDHFQTLLESIVASPETTLSELCLLTEAERQQLLVEWNNTTSLFPKDKCIHELFEVQAALTPNAVAVIYEDSQISYAELNAQANQLAHYLRDSGVKPDTLVAICFERCLAMMVGILAILKAGGAYVPLDPAYPKDRLLFMVEDSDPLLLLIQHRFKSLFSDMSKTLPMIDLESHSDAWTTQPDTNLDLQCVGLTPKNLAYVIYTSGSTGLPKGVMIEHSGVCNLVTDLRNRYEIKPEDRILQFIAISFDPFVEDIFVALLSGATLVLRNDDWITGATKFWALCEKNSVSIASLPTQFWQELVQEANAIIPSTVRICIIGGEAVNSKVLTDWFKREGYRPILFNGYGPTETTVTATIHEPLIDSLSLQSIGRPLSNTRTYILDANGQPVPIGIAGELHIGGAGVARGYLNRPELTLERFVSDPFSSEPNARIYKTGDLTRYLSDGTIEFLGRIDHQVKLRGFRIELGEIESLLGQHYHVNQAIVVMQEYQPNDKRLVAYITHSKHEAPNVNALRHFLKEKLPEYMIPSAFMFLDSFPLTPNGKLDRKALPLPDQSQYEYELGSNFVTPHSEIEKQLAEIWSNVLRIARIGIHDNFFQLGGHSLLAIQVIVRIREQLSVEISLNALFNVPTIAELARLIENTNVSALNTSKTISRQPRSTDNTGNAENPTIFPASFSQQGLWLVDRLSGNTQNYNIFEAFKLKGELDIAALETAINTIIHRHEALRTYFAEQDGEPVQVIHPAFAITLPVVDVRNYSDQQKAAELEQFIQRNKMFSFDLEKLPLIQFQLLRLAEEEYIFALVFYHIIFDGWSVDIFIRELSALYNAFIQGRTPSLSELTIQYADYTVWQQESLQGETMQQLLTYWKLQLKDAPTLELLTDRPRPAIQSFRGCSQPFSVSPDLSEKLKVLSQQEGVSLFMTLLATFQVLLHRYSGQDDIVIGTPSAGRGHIELEDLIGFFVNTLALRVDTSGNPCFRELLARVREVALSAYANQNISFEKLVEAVNPKRDPSHNPLFQVMFILQNTPDIHLHLKEITAEYLKFDTETTKFDLTCELFETPDGLIGRVEYATDLFDASTIDRFIRHFQMLLEGIVEHPEARLSDFPLLTESERQQLLVDWNNTDAPFPSEKCIHELFEAQVAKTPQAVALIYEGNQLTYAELNAQANQMAHYLRNLGVKPETLVAICVERCLNMVVAMLAVLKAGGAYVPFNPTYPDALLTSMIEDSNPLALITQGKLEKQFTDTSKTLTVIDLDVTPLPWKNQPDTNLNRDETGLNPENLAYIIYTSGSTGVPKGVMAEHKGVCNMVTDIKNRYQMKPEDRMLQFAALAFDVSVQEIFITLTSGAGLVLRNDNLKLTGENWLSDASSFWSLCVKNGITVVKLPTAFWQQIIQEEQTAIPASIRLNIIGGEAVNSNVLAAWFNCKNYRPKLFNAYGPTETTVNSTIHETSANSLSWQSIGRPIANTKIYILDANRQPVPIGLAGELYIGGAGVARGYFNRPERSEEKFMSDPFAKEPDARMYKTGDLVRWLADGTIEFLGRNDFQVKIRGFRIELGHIEATLLKHPAVREVAVLAFDREGIKSLVAYLVIKDNSMPGVSELRDFLKTRLSEFMIPSAFVFLDALPLTFNGKLDRKALPKPDLTHLEANTAFVAPRNQLEKQLAEIWSRILKIDRLSIHDNFFESGGHSLLAVKIIVEINKLFNTDLPLGIIYQHPTVEELGTSISSGNQQLSWYSLVPIQTQGSRPPLFAIHTLVLEDLPRCLGKNQPFYFIRYGMAAERNDSTVQLPPLEKLASHYISEILQLQPQGPYYLIGFSFGGLIAYEMARQLVENGHKVNFIGLLDTYMTDEKPILLPYHQIIRKCFKLNYVQLMELIKTKINYLLKQNRLHKIKTDSPFNTTDRDKAFRPHVYSEIPDLICRNNYQAKLYNDRVTLFQADDRESMFFNDIAPELAWKNLLGDKLEVHQVTGKHLEICVEPHAQTLAEKIIACMDKAINQ